MRAGKIVCKNNIRNINNITQYALEKNRKFLQLHNIYKNKYKFMTQIHRK